MTKSSGTWRWTTSDRDGDPGLRGRSGALAAAPAASDPATIFMRHGFWNIPPGGRNLMHADGTSRLLCADTAWALPWRATAEQAEVYAQDRQTKGFNAALLMTVQPDMDCKGPRSRTEDLGFDMGFEGSRYPGIAAKIFDGLPFADMQPNWTYTYGRRGLAVPGKLFVLYLPEGGGTGITSLDVPRAYRVYDPRTGQEVGKGRLPDQAPVQFNSGSSGGPRVAVFTAATP